jgi:hypothetical protein
MTKDGVREIAKLDASSFFSPGSTPFCAAMTIFMIGKTPTSYTYGLPRRHGIIEGWVGHCPPNAEVTRSIVSGAPRNQGAITDTWVTVLPKNFGGRQNARA